MNSERVFLLPSASSWRQGPKISKALKFGCKPLIFQSFPIIFDVMHLKPLNSPSICLVISPLSSLMQDQVMYLNSVGIKAAFIGDDQTDEEVKRNVETGYYQLVYGFPEAFLASSRWP
jgi:superfamily II DNA helicase RecQ